MATPPSLQTADLPVVSFVELLKHDDDRGTLALLRGALADSKERQMRAWRLLARFGGIPIEADFFRAEAVRTVAGLLALPGLRHERGGKSFGAACLCLVGSEERKSLHKAEQLGPIARRVQTMLAANRNEVCGRVRHLGRRLENAGAGLDFNRLYDDLVRWSDYSKARWAADFWGAAPEDQSSTQEPGA